MQTPFEESKHDGQTNLLHDEQRISSENVPQTSHLLCTISIVFIVYKHLFVARRSDFIHYAEKDFLLILKRF